MPGRRGCAAAHHGCHMMGAPTAGVRIDVSGMPSTLAVVRVGVGGYRSPVPAQCSASQFPRNQAIACPAARWHALARLAAAGDARGQDCEQLRGAPPPCSVPGGAGHCAAGGHAAFTFTDCAVGSTCWLSHVALSSPRGHACQDCSVSEGSPSAACGLYLKWHKAVGCIPGSQSQ